MLKKKIMFICPLITVSALLFGCKNANITITTSPSAGNTDYSELIGDIPTTQEFTDDPIDETDIEKILTAGINAPSAMNKQPWHFSAVTNKEILEQIAGDMSGGMPPMGDKPPMDDKAPEGDKPPMGNNDKKDMPAPPAGGAKSSNAGIADAPAAIIISCTDGSEFDAGLACESMADMANVMGYGTKILSSPTMALNGEKKDEYKELLKIPKDQSVVAVLLVGHTKEPVDSMTGATERNPFGEVAGFIR